MKNKKIKKYWFILFPVLLVILSELLEFLIDYIFGNKDGYIARYNIGKYLTKFQILLLILGFTIFSFKTKKTWLINISIFIILWFLLEVGFGLIIYKRKRNISNLGSYTENYFVSDSNLGYKSKPSSIVNSIEIINQDTIYNVYYTTDNYSRRVAFPVNTDSLKYYAIFFGGSITFGEGVNDNETFVNKFNIYYPNYYPYNYGFCGYGTNQMLAKLQDPDFKNEIGYDSGICVYAYLEDHHIRRAIGSMSVVSAWASKTPFYTYNANGELVRKGNFADNRTFKTILFKILGSSNIIKYLNLDIPFKLKPKHYQFMADMINQCYRKYKEKFSNNNFFVLILPGSLNEIKNYLKDSEIKIIDMSSLFNLYENRLDREDLHLNAIGHNIVADELSKKLFIK